MAATTGNEDRMTTPAARPDEPRAADRALAACGLSRRGPAAGLRGPAGHPQALPDRQRAGAGRPGACRRCRRAPAHPDPPARGAAHPRRRQRTHQRGRHRPRLDHRWPRPAGRSARPGLRLAPDRPATTGALAWCRVSSWLRTGYPAGLPDHDYLPLVALLRRRLSDEEVHAVSRLLAEGGTIAADRVDIGTAVAKVTSELPSEDGHQPGRGSTSPSTGGPRPRGVTGTRS